MKSKFTLKEKSKEIKRKYPLLAKDRETDLVVLFTDSKTGTVVNVDYSYNLGHYENDWEDIDDGGWEIFPPGTKVTLTQE